MTSPTDAAQDERISATRESLERHLDDCGRRYEKIWEAVARVHERIDNLISQQHTDMRKLYWMIGGATLLILAGEAGILGVLKGLIGV